MTLRYILKISATLSLLFMLSCSQGPSVQLLVRMPSNLATDFTILNIVLEITGDGIDSPIVQELSADEIADPVIFNVDVPIGNARHILVRAPTNNLDPVFQGFFGEATLDVIAAAEISIPMRFVNFAEDEIGDGTASQNAATHPDITYFEVLTGVGPDFGFQVCNNGLDNVLFLLRVQAPYAVANEFETIIEFDIDNDITTGGATEIEALRDAVPALFPTGSERYIHVIIDSAGLTELLELFDNDNKNPLGLITSIDDVFEAEWSPANQQLMVCMTRELFRGEVQALPNIGIDPDEFGAMNVLVIDNNISFEPNDIAYEGGTMLYDLNFDTTGL